MNNILVRGYEVEPTSQEEEQERIKHDNKKSIKRDIFSIIRGRGYDIQDMPDMWAKTS